MNLFKIPNSRQQGFSYVEVMAATLILALCLVPAMEALEASGKTARVPESLGVDRYHLLDKMEWILTQPFNDLDAAAQAAGSESTASSYSDLITSTDGRSLTRNVYLSRYDGDNLDDSNPFTGTDEGLLWIRIVIEGTTLIFETLASR
jgi:type II secretory pathway component PulJ